MDLFFKLPTVIIIESGKSYPHDHIHGPARLWSQGRVLFHIFLQLLVDILHGIVNLDLMRNRAPQGLAGNHLLVSESTFLQLLFKERSSSIHKTVNLNILQITVIWL